MDKSEPRWGTGSRPRMWGAADNKIETRIYNGAHPIDLEGMLMGFGKRRYMKAGREYIEEKRRQAEESRRSEEADRNGDREPPIASEKPPIYRDGAESYGGSGRTGSAACLWATERSRDVTGKPRSIRYGRDGRQDIPTRLSTTGPVQVR